MDLENMLKEGEIADLGWLDEETFEPSEMDLDMEEQLAIQWDDEIDQLAKDGIAERKIDVEDILEQEEEEYKEEAERKCVIFMLSGYDADFICDKLKGIFASRNMPKDIKKYAKKREGMIGTFLVDCKHIKDAGEYKEASKNSPYKGLHQYAINCKCEHKVADTQIEVGGGTIDGLMGSEVEIVKQARVCKKTGLPVLASFDDYSNEDAVRIMSKLVKFETLDSETTKRLLTEEKPVIAVKKAFQIVLNADKTANKQRYSQKVDASGYMMEESKMVAELSEQGFQSWEVDDINEATIATDVEESNDVLDVVVGEKHSSMDIGQYDGIQTALDVDETEAELDIELDGEIDTSMIDVDGEEADNNDFFEQEDGMSFDSEEMDIDVDSDDFESLDVDGRSEFNF